MTTSQLAPGDIVIHRCNAAKHRPWLTLWVDDEIDMCLLAAVTQTGMRGLSDVKLPVPEYFKYTNVGGWVMRWPTATINANYVYRYPEITPAVVAHARSEIKKLLDL